MSKGLPEFIYPLRFACSGRFLQGRVPVDEMPRLAAGLYDWGGHVAVNLQFGREEEGRLCVRGVVEAELRLECQRCLEPFVFSATSDVRLGLIRSEESAADLPPECEPLLVEEEPISLFAMVEDELILALPIVPMHPRDVCSATVYGVPSKPFSEPQNNPFAVLLSTNHRS
jgi:uncharacterized protein